MSQTGSLEEKTDDEIKRILEVEYGFEFEGPLHDEAPVPKAKYVLKYGQETNPLVDKIRSYLLETYIIKDPFGTDHSARRDFITRFTAEYPTSFFERRSKLRGNQNVSVLTSANLVGDDVRRINPKAYRRLKEIFPPGRGVFSDEIYNCINRYNEMDFDEKVAFVKKLDMAAYQFLKALS